LIDLLDVYGAESERGKRVVELSSSVCCVTLLEADAAEGEVDAESDAASEVSAADDADAFFEVETVCALEPDPPVPLDEPEFVLLPVWELLDEFEGAAISAVLLVVLCELTAVELDGGADVFGALNSPAACAVDADHTVWDDGVKLS